MSTCSIDRQNAVFLLLLVWWPVGPQSQRREEEKGTHQSRLYEAHMVEK
jgi:hypothetical protein